ncbi:transposase [Gluconacetobacter diazotrophicus]|uniref:transposase n=1 Tax=Gluconacetobacter diazotrophicus TaxID=33996 RepID=UPI0038D0CD3A
MRPLCSGVHIQSLNHTSATFQTGSQILPRRWVVERTFAWLGRCRRLAKDWEQSIASSTAWTWRDRRTVD